MSSKGIAISEKHSDEKFGEESRIGIPFNFLMRDVIQFDGSLQDAIKLVCVCVCVLACVCMCAFNKHTLTTQTYSRGPSYLLNLARCWRQKREDIQADRVLHVNSQCL